MKQLRMEVDRTNKKHLRTNHLLTIADWANRDIGYLESKLTMHYKL